MAWKDKSAIHILNIYMSPKKPIIHNIGTKLIMFANRFFFTRKIQARMEQAMTATGYNVMARTKEILAKLNPLSKLINDIDQMTNQGNKKSAYKIWLIIK